ncbi:MAG: hypothetical protein ACLSHL_10295 [Alistipes communis]
MLVKLRVITFLLEMNLKSLNEVVIFTWLLFPQWQNRSPKPFNILISQGKNNAVMAKDTFYSISGGKWDDGWQNWIDGDVHGNTGRCFRGDYTQTHF